MNEPISQKFHDSLVTPSFYKTKTIQIQNLEATNMELEMDFNVSSESERVSFLPRQPPTYSPYQVKDSFFGNDS